MSSSKPSCRALRSPLAGLLAAACMAAAQPTWAVDNVLLIQMKPGSRFVVWHTEGPTRLTEDETITLEGSATPEGGPEITTGAGPARAYETADGVIIRLPAAGEDNALLLDADNCGHVRTWHAAGAMRLSDETITEIFISALPDGGPRLRIGDQYVKAYLGKLGVTASFWPADGQLPEGHR